jgi:hypothetical protein
MAALQGSVEDVGEAQLDLPEAEPVRDGLTESISIRRVFTICGRSDSLRSKASMTTASIRVDLEARSRSTWP